MPPAKISVLADVFLRNFFGNFFRNNIMASMAFENVFPKIKNSDWPIILNAEA